MAVITGSAVQAYLHPVHQLRLQWMSHGQF